MPLTELSGLYVYLGPRGTPDGTGAPRPAAARARWIVSVRFDLARRAERSFHLTFRCANGKGAAQTESQMFQDSYHDRTPGPAYRRAACRYRGSAVSVPWPRAPDSAPARRPIQSPAFPTCTTNTPKINMTVLRTLRSHALSQHCLRTLHPVPRRDPRPQANDLTAQVPRSARRPWRQRMRARPPPVSPCSPSNAAVAETLCRALHLASSCLGRSPMPPVGWYE